MGEILGSEDFIDDNLPSPFVYGIDLLSWSDRDILDGYCLMRRGGVVANHQNEHAYIADKCFEIGTDVPNEIKWSFEGISKSTFARYNRVYHATLRLKLYITFHSGFS